MASYATTPPSTAGRKDGRYGKMPALQRQPLDLGMSPTCSPWPNAPPTPEDSQASACQTPSHSPRTLPALHLTHTPVDASRPESEVGSDLDNVDEASALDDDIEDDIVLVQDSGNAAMTASLRRSQPTLITIGPKMAGRENREAVVYQESREQHDSQDASEARKDSKDMRMQQWLSQIPAPVTPQERYIQGLSAAVDHPLHPQPLRVVQNRQTWHLGNMESSTEEDDLPAECEKLTITESDKENANMHNQRDSLEVSKKRHVSAGSAEGGAARKRIKLLDPVRRFSLRLSSSLSLGGGGGGSDYGSRDSNDLSCEDVARQNEQLHKFSKLRGVPTVQSRLSFAKPSQAPAVRAQAASTLRRMMASKVTLAMTASGRDGDYATWSEGRPDMLVNVAFIGDARVGKTALIRRLVQQGASSKPLAPGEVPEPTLRLVVDGTRVQLNLCEDDSGRQANQPSILALGWFSVVVLCFDIGQQTSLESLQKYRNDIAMYEEKSIVIMAGLKKDARRHLPALQLSFIEDPVQVDTETASHAAVKLGCSSYVECSSLSSCEGVDELFGSIVQSGVDLQRARNKTMARFRRERSVDKGMTRIAEGVRSLFTF